jgi:hypothetical protein
VVICNVALVSCCFICMLNHYWSRTFAGGLIFWNWESNWICREVLYGPQIEKKTSKQFREFITRYMSNTPAPSMSNLTYAVQNANETLYRTPHVILPILTNVFSTNSNMQMQLGPKMQTSTPIYSTFAQTCEYTRSRSHEYTNINNKPTYVV